MGIEKGGFVMSTLEILAIMLTIFTIIGMVSWSICNQVLSTDRQGCYKSATGVVTELGSETQYSNTFNRRVRTYYMSYRYVVDSNCYFKTITSTRKPKCRVRGTIDILYNPSNPQKSVIKCQSKSLAIVSRILLIMNILLVVADVITYGLLNARRMTDLLH